MNQSDFDIKQTHILNSLRDLKIKGLEKIDISRLLFNVSGEALKATKTESIKKLLRTVFFNVINIEYINKKGNLPTIISYDYHREDHTRYWEMFKCIVSEYNEIRIDEGRKNYCKCRTPREIVSILSNFFFVKKKISRIGDSTIRRVIATNLSELIVLKKYLDRHNNYGTSAFIFLMETGLRT